MPRIKKIEVETTVPAEPTKKRAAATARPTVTHKHTTPKKSSKPAMEPAELTHAAIAQLAYSYWLERGCQGGSEHEDWLRAEQELRKQLSL